MLVIAHRGFSSQYTENTIIAFQQALMLDVDAIELDIHQVEHEFLVFHDPYVDKLTNGKGRIFDMPLKQARQLLVNDKYTIPTLGEVAALIGNKVILNIEVKSLRSVKEFVIYVKHFVAAYQCKVVISSFDHPLLMAIKTSFSDFTEAQRPLKDAYPVEFAGLIAHAPFDHAKYASNLGVLIAATDWNTVNADFVEDAHRRGKKVWCYTVNHQATLIELLDIGVDGIFTDRPDWARQFITDRVSIAQGSIRTF
ncbi:MAG: glycerophosphoryl diester phosphodiesterase [Glaciecola sp.]|jgi:glycerophosphoryl diester phosphodiesterase